MPDSVQNESFIDRIILMPINIPRRSGLRASQSRGVAAVNPEGAAGTPRRRSQARELPRKPSFDRARNAGRSSSALKAPITSILSRRSASRWAGFLEGMNRVAQDVRPDQRLKRSPIHDVARTVKDIVDVELHSGM
jgi:hypothetical protein